MKKLALVITLFTSIGMNAFAQGYVVFATTKNNVYDEFTDPGVGVPAPGDVNVTFLWASVGTPDPLGTGIPTAEYDPYTGYSAIPSMLSSGWTIAENAGNGNAEADVAVASGAAQGGIGYNGGVAFKLAGTTGGDTYEFVVIGWDNQFGDPTLEEGMDDGAALGWSGSFDYMTGATSGSVVDVFSNSGESPFGVDPIPVPEPTTIALAGLGGLSLLRVRRKS